MHVVATAGHVDHGKSALVRALTGTDPDRFVEEQQRGLTIDLGFAWMTLPAAGAVEFVDVPGHVRFISNMLAGVAVIEAGLLCVDAREGWRAQTEEHLRILDLIGLPAGLIALTKSGLVDHERLAAAQAEVEHRLAGTVLDGAPIVACDSLAGIGLDELRDQLDRILAGHASAPDDGRARLWVDRSFTIGGAGTVVTGGVGHGAFAPSDQVETIGPGGHRSARVRGIQALGHRVDRAPAGSRAALNLAGIDRHAVRRGDAVVHPDQWRPSGRVDASLQVLDSVDHDVTGRGAYLAYVGTGEHAVRLRVLDGSALGPGSTGVVRLTFGRQLPLVAGDRYVLRDTGRAEVIGGGAVIDVAPTRRRTGLARPEHDWVAATELEQRLGIHVEPTLEGWVVSPSTLRTAKDALLSGIDQARPIGLDVALLDERQRAVVRLLEREQQAEITAGYAVAPSWRDELAGHPFVVLLEQDLFSPPAPTMGNVSPEVLRALIRRQLVVVKDGIYFAGKVRSAAAKILAELAKERPDGFTVSDARQALGTTRRWAVPLLEVLDESGITIRHGDRRHLRTP
jgi:selenocysteine-specific elongation factor